MKPYFLLALVAASIAGCAGLDITPMSADEDAKAHTGNTAVKGYVIYGPMVVVEVTQKQVCSKTNAQGTCDGPPESTCMAGTPFALPDPSKPFLVNARSGFGKAGVDVAITNGWQLGSIKDNSDNTAILGIIEKLLPLKAATALTPNGSPEKCKAGLYRVTLNPKSSEVELTSMHLYQTPNPAARQ